MGPGEFWKTSQCSHTDDARTKKSNIAAKYREGCVLCRIRRRRHAGQDRTRMHQPMMMPTKIAIPTEMPTRCPTPTSAMERLADTPEDPAPRGSRRRPHRPPAGFDSGQKKAADAMALTRDRDQALATLFVSIARLIPHQEHFGGGTAFRVRQIGVDNEGAPQTARRT